MNKSQLIDALAQRFEGNRKQAAHALDAVLDTITREVVKGEKVAITGFGSFEKRVRQARWVRNPQTGDRIKAKKTTVPKFTAGQDLKNIVSGAKKLPKLAAPAAKKATAPARKAASAAKSAATSRQRRSRPPRSRPPRRPRPRPLPRGRRRRRLPPRRPRRRGRRPRRLPPRRPRRRSRRPRRLPPRRLRRRSRGQEVDGQEGSGQEDRQEVHREEDRQEVLTSHQHDGPPPIRGRPVRRPGWAQPSSRPTRARAVVAPTPRSTAARRPAVSSTSRRSVGHAPVQLDRPGAGVGGPGSLAEARVEGGVRRGVERGAGAVGVAHERLCVGRFGRHRGQRRGEVGAAQGRQIGAQRHRARAGPPASRLARRLAQHGVQAAGLAVRDRHAAQCRQPPSERGVVGGGEHRGHPVRAEARRGGVERERPGEIASLVVGEAAQPRLPGRRRLHRQDDHVLL